MSKSNYSDMWVFIPVGGKGSRLMPFTKNRGKPLVPLFNHFPICEIIIFELAQLGFRKFIFGVRGTDHYHQLNDYFQGGYGFSASLGIKPQINFIYQNPNYHDTGSADSCVYNLKRLGITQPVLVVMGDNLFDSAQIRLFIAKSLSGKFPFTIALQETNTPEYFGIAELSQNGKIVHFVEKPKPNDTKSNLASCAIYLIKPEVFSHLEGDFGKNTIPKLCKMGLLGGIPITGWLNLDTPAQHLTVFQHLIHNPKTLLSFFNQTYNHLQFPSGTLWVRGKSSYSNNHNAYLFQMVASGQLVIRGNVLIGRDCQIGVGCYLENSSLGDMTILDDNASITDSNILDAWSCGRSVTIANSFLGRGGRVGDCSVISDSYIGDNLTLPVIRRIANQTLPKLT